MPPTAARRIGRASRPNTSDRPGRRRFARPGFVLRNSLNLFSNFTYFLDDPEQRRSVRAGRAAHGGRRPRDVSSARPLLRAPHGKRRRRAAAARLARSGRPVSHGRAGSGSRRRARIEVGQTMAGVYAQTEIEWTRALRTTLGLRADVYQFAVTSDNPLNSGDGSDGLVSPKFGAVFGPWAGTEILRQRRHGLSQQRRARRGDSRRSGHRRSGRSRDAAGSREGRGSWACARCASADCSRRWRSGISASTPSCCSSATRARPNRDVRAAASASNGPTTRA